MLPFFKLHKLKIEAYKDEDRTELAKTFEAMFNPTSYSQTHYIRWSKLSGINDTQETVHYLGSRGETLSLDLVLDGTGTDEVGAFALFRKSVKARVKDFFDTTLRYNGTIHQPYYLRVTWGALDFSCRLQNVTIKYTAFERDGSPLRAELTVELKADVPPRKRAQLAAKESPDLTHARIVRSGDTLPLLAKEVYGSADRYMDVARWNGLDDFRRLTPGQEILFPPLATLRGASGQK